MRPLSLISFFVVGATGFEPATAWSQTRSATGLRYNPEGTINPNCGAKVVTFIQTTKLSRLFFLRRQKITCQRERMARGYRVTFFAY